MTYMRDDSSSIATSRSDESSKDGSSSSSSSSAARSTAAAAAPPAPPAPAAERRMSTTRIQIALPARKKSSLSTSSSSTEQQEVSTSTVEKEHRRLSVSTSTTATAAATPHDSAWKSNSNNRSVLPRSQQQQQQLYDNDKFVTPTPHRGASGVLATESSSKNESTSNSNSNSSSREWPRESCTSLPLLSDHLKRGLQQQAQQQQESSSTSIQLPINEECTALKLTPSGRLIVAAFTDGTLRIFDLTGRFLTSSSTTSMQQVDNTDDDGFDSDASFDPPLDDQAPTTTAALATTTAAPSSKHKGFVDSKHFQSFGAVAAQIHAKGVHTSLSMDVDVSEDGLWAFAGVLRGSMELLAVHLGHLENSENSDSESSSSSSAQVSKASSDTTMTAATPMVANSTTTTTTLGNTTSMTTATTASSGNSNLLDYVSVYRHSDAKLRGFGACTRLKTPSDSNAPLQYLLFTGKAIKNIHVWSFTPPQHDGQQQQQPVWTQLYDTQTNGNTIKLLQFRRHFTTGKLQALSKSDGQRLRVWDLDVLENNNNSDNNDNKKTSSSPKKRPPQPSSRFASNTSKLGRPAFEDVAHSEQTLGVSGGFCICGGSELYNQMKIVCLDGSDDDLLQSPYNHTELALPSSMPSSSSTSTSSDTPSLFGGSSSSTSRTSRRQQRGELKSITSVAGAVLDAGYILLELSDGSVLQYSQNPETHLPMLQFPRHKVFSNITTDGTTSRKMAVARIGRGGLAVAAVATYHAATGRGQISLLSLEESPDALDRTTRSGFWGFCGQSTLPMLPSSSSPTSNSMSPPPPVLPLASGSTAASEMSTDLQQDAKMDGGDSVVANTTTTAKRTLETLLSLANDSTSKAATTKEDDKMAKKKKKKRESGLPLARSLAAHMDKAPAPSDHNERRVSLSPGDAIEKEKKKEEAGAAESDSNLSIKSSSKGRNAQAVSKIALGPKESKSRTPTKKSSRTSAASTAATESPSGSKQKNRKTATKRSEIAEQTGTTTIGKRTTRDPPSAATGKRSRKEGSEKPPAKKLRISSSTPTKASSSRGKSSGRSPAVPSKRSRKAPPPRSNSTDAAVQDSGRAKSNKALSSSSSSRSNKRATSSKKTQGSAGEEGLLRLRITEECQHQRGKVEGILQSFPQSSWARRQQGQTVVDDSDKPAGLIRLEAEHHAARSGLTRKIWDATHSMIVSVEECPTVNAVKQAKQMMCNVLGSYRQMAIGMLHRHEMEMTAFRGTMALYNTSYASKGTNEDGNGPSLFDFDVFQQSLDCMPSMDRISAAASAAAASDTATNSD